MHKVDTVCKIHTMRTGTWIDPDNRPSLKSHLVKQLLNKEVMPGPEEWIG